MANLADTEIVGNLTVTGQVQAQSFYATSDARLKENIKTFDYKGGILDLPIYEFNYKNGGEHTIGCMAQDLIKICPELVKKDSNGILHIQENKLLYLLLMELKKIKNGY